MQEVTQALDQIKELYQKVVGRPAPQIPIDSFASFPPGIDPVAHALQELNDLKRLTNQMTFAPRPTSWLPVADTFLRDGDLLVRVEIPGVRRDDLRVFVAGGECVVRGERQQPVDEGELQPLNLERPWGSFERRFPLPVGCDAGHVHARYVDGVLELHFEMDETGITKHMKVEVA